MQILLLTITVTSNKIQYISTHLLIDCLFNSLLRLICSRSHCIDSTSAIDDKNKNKKTLFTVGTYKNKTALASKWSLVSDIK